MLITLAQAAEKLGRSPSTLREQIRRGQLKAEKIGRDWLLEEGEVERYRAASVAQGAGRPSLGRVVAQLAWQSHAGGPATVIVIVNGPPGPDDIALGQVAQQSLDHGAWTNAELWANARQDARVQGRYEVSVRLQSNSVALIFDPRGSDQ
jgi:excisionase family DNA binding protein